MLPPSSGNQLSLLPEGRGRGIGTYFLQKRKEKKKPSFLLWWWFGGIRSAGAKFASPYPRAQAHTCTYLGSSADPGPSQLEFCFCQGPGTPLLPQQAWHKSQTKPVASTVLPFLRSQAGVASQRLPFR